MAYTLEQFACDKQLDTTHIDDVCRFIAQHTIRNSSNIEHLKKLAPYNLQHMRDTAEKDPDWLAIPYGEWLKAGRRMCYVMTRHGITTLTTQEKVSFAKQMTRTLIQIM